MPLWMGYFLSCMKHAHTQLDPSSPLGVYEKEMPDWHDMQTTVIVGKNCRPLWNWSYFEQIETNNMAGSGRNCSSFFFVFSLWLSYFYFHIFLSVLFVYLFPFSLLTPCFPFFTFCSFLLPRFPLSSFSAFWFLSLCYFSIFLHESVSVTLHLISPPLPSLISTRAAGEISRNPLPPFPTRHRWSVSESI